MKPLRMKGRVVHQIGLPYHWSSKGLVRSDSTNELIMFVGDPNVAIQESKAFSGMIVAGRKSNRRRPLVTQIDPLNSLRDLPAAQRKPDSQHGHKDQETKEGNN